MDLVLIKREICVTSHGKNKNNIKWKTRAKIGYKILNVDKLLKVE